MGNTAPTFLQWRRDALLAEYAAVAETWRHLLGIRFGLMTIAAATETVLFGAYRYIATHPSELGMVSAVARIALPFFGVVMTYAIMVIEFRTRIVRRHCLIRGLMLESVFEIWNGHFHQIRQAPAPFLGTQTAAVYVIYSLVYASWAFITFVELAR